MKIFSSRDGTAIVETALVFPLFLLLAFGITDIGNAVFARMSVNAASQSGASYIVSHAGATRGDVQIAMNQAVGNSSFCATATCSVFLQSQCAPAPAQCIITVTASSAWTPMLPTTTYSWALPLTITYTTTIRIA
jgi:Flp pilus assembly protein TadG